ncbi:hypothetical protein J3458_013135 [Metarhizium acridum]|uniref:uncharacterized protein n=1 Tax=Metarhizium acridum TaxID=92637 RepID=UPI001C6BAA6D|nr:hypothetical protein J3458_013135 [Metarhizium acridum]
MFAFGTAQYNLWTPDLGYADASRIRPVLLPSGRPLTPHTIQNHRTKPDNLGLRSSSALVKSTLFMPTHGERLLPSQHTSFCLDDVKHHSLGYISQSQKRTISPC